ncbi:carbonic anhydrase 7-like [Prorops nasuta]|uniref:carbonic anhydrase 7-like n=1 Tax=Prorops nasuta TaxID=863751 RepID=UPI0034CD3D64
MPGQSQALYHREILALVGLLLIISSSCLAANNFSYDGDHGPSYWYKYYSTCVGKHQSPINIDEHRVTRVDLPYLQFSGTEAPRKMNIYNNGHTVMLKMNDPGAIILAGGPLRDFYVFEQLHFHWGDTDDRGSEDLINNHSFAMELHAVFYKNAYGSAGEAMNHPDGLAVLAYLFEAGDEENIIYKPIVNELDDVHKVDSSKLIDEPMDLHAILQSRQTSIQDYFTYNGSLTTPPCLEVVTWIDFKYPQKLSHEQLESFRNIDSNDGNRLTHNFRPVQPLDGRIVYHNVPYLDHHRTRHSPTKFYSNGGLLITASVSLIVTLLFLAL